MRRSFVIPTLLFAFSLPLPSCSHGGSNNVTTAAAPGDSTAASGLRSPRGPRGQRGLRSPAERRMATLPPAAAAADPASPGTPAGVPGSAAAGSFDASTNTGALNAGGARYSFSGQDRSFSITPSRSAANSTAGRTQALPSITYNPVTRTWNWN